MNAIFTDQHAIEAFASRRHVDLKNLKQEAKELKLVITQSGRKSQDRIGFGVSRKFNNAVGDIGICTILFKFAVQNDGLFSASK